MRSSLVLTTVIVITAIGCGVSNGASSDTSTENEQIDAWAEDFCAALIDFSNQVRTLRPVDPIAYFEAIARIANTHAGRIAAVKEVGATRDYQNTAANGLRGLGEALNASIPRIRAAIAAQDRAAIDAEQARIAAVLDSVQKLTDEGLKDLPARAIAAMNLIPGCTRQNQLVPADSTGRSNK